MSASDLDALLSELKALPKGTTARGALKALGSKMPAAEQAARRRCALVRWLDEPLYDFLTEDIGDRPEFKAFCAAGGVQRLGHSRFVLDDAERAELLAEWQTNEPEWKQWNQKLGDYFIRRAGADEQLCAVYHLAASPDPTVVLPWFEKWYKDADDRFDMPQCHGLLEMLRVQHDYRGPLVSPVVRDRTRYFDTRMMFAEEYYKTGSYFGRTEALEKFQQVLEPAAGATDPWIFHIHATGGTGKTMFLRWLESRYLVPRRIPCARVDFDDFRPLTDLINRPLRLLVKIVEQWSRQVVGLDTVLGDLNREEGMPDWNPAALKKLGLGLAGASLKSPMVVILDTLEETTLSHADWLKDCVDTLRNVRKSIPMLKLVLSGRYDIAGRSKALIQGEYLPYELPRFTEQESHEYLQSRGIAPGEVRDAIVERAGYDETPGEDGADTLKGRNPFKLAIFAEIVMNRQNVDAQYIRDLPRADIAYLLERVIKRIEAQPVRWTIRYGAIARHLTPEFVDQVLLPPLREALRGNLPDQPERDLDDANQDAWMAQSELADQVTAEALWTELKKYARHRGWISEAAVGGEIGLRFHPEVVGPTRGLLDKQHIFPVLQARAMEYFEAKAAATETWEVEWIRYTREAIFHRFQLQGWHRRRDAGPADANSTVDYWRDRVRRAEKFSAGRALKIAEEILGPDYAKAEQTPIEGISTLELLMEAHSVAADLLLQDAGMRFTEGQNWEEFRRHCVVARDIAAKSTGASFPSHLTLLLDARSEEPAREASALMEARRSASEPRTRFFLTLHAAQKLMVLRSELSARLYREALELLPSVERTGINASDLWLGLASHYEFEGSHTAVVGCLQEARAAADDEKTLGRVLERETAHALGTGDVESAAARLSELSAIETAHHPTPATRNVLAARLALANADPLAAITEVSGGREVSKVDRDIARMADQRGEAEALLLEFTAALGHYESAAASYDLAKEPTGAARCMVISARLHATVTENFKEAESLVEAGLKLRGSQDASIYSELMMLRAFVAARRGNRAKAVQIVDDLLRPRTPLWPPPIRAKVLLFGLFFGLRKPDAGFLADVLETMADLQPLTFRDSVLEWAAFCRERIDVPVRFIRSLMSSLVISRPGTASAVWRLICRADVLRVFGDHQASASQLRKAADAAFGLTDVPALLMEWELNQARRRLGVGTRFRDLMVRSSASALAGTVLHEAIRVAAARESNDEQLARFTGRLDTEVANVFHAEKLELLASMGGPQNMTAQKEAELYYKTLGWEAASRAGHGGVAIASRDVSQNLIDGSDVPEQLVDRMLKDLGKFGEELSEGVLKASHGVIAENMALDPESRLGGLPWEMAPVLRKCRTLYRRSESAPLLDMPPVAAEPMKSVLFVGQEEREAESDETVSGVSIEGLYGQMGAWPSTVRGTDSHHLQQLLGSELNPVLIHIAAALRETDSGIYLDFEGTRTRALSFAVEFFDEQRGTADLDLSVSRVDRTIQRLKQPPFVVLDVSHPFNRTAAIRMLLARNRFAKQLFALGHVRGILGCGLAAPNERYQFSFKTVEGLMTRSVAETLNALRQAEPPMLDDIEMVMPRLGAALWTNKPDDCLFTARKEGQA